MKFLGFLYNDANSVRVIIDQGNPPAAFEDRFNIAPAESPLATGQSIIVTTRTTFFDVDGLTPGRHYIVTGGRYVSGSLVGSYDFLSWGSHPPYSQFANGLQHSCLIGVPPISVRMYDGSFEQLMNRPASELFNTGRWGFDSISSGYDDLLGGDYIFATHFTDLVSKICLDLHYDVSVTFKYRIATEAGHSNFVEAWFDFYSSEDDYTYWNFYDGTQYVAEIDTVHTAIMAFNAATKVATLTVDGHLIKTTTWNASGKARTPNHIYLLWGNRLTPPGASFQIGPITYNGKLIFGGGDMFNWGDWRNKNRGFIACEEGNINPWSGLVGTMLTTGVNPLQSGRSCFADNLLIDDPVTADPNRPTWIQTPLFHAPTGQKFKSFNAVYWGTCSVQFFDSYGQLIPNAQITGNSGGLSAATINLQNVTASPIYAEITIPATNSVRSLYVDFIAGEIVDVGIDTLADVQLGTNTVALTGWKNPNGIIIIECRGATVGEVTYPTNSTWSCSLTNIQSGKNSITATGLWNDKPSRVRLSVWST